MVAADSVVMRDRAAGLDHGLGDPRLDPIPQLDLRPLPARAHERVVRGRTVGIDVREAAGDAPLAAVLLQSVARRLHDVLSLSVLNKRQDKFELHYFFPLSTAN